MTDSPGAGDLVIVSGVPSDSHTWNLVYLQLYIEEYGFEVHNLGPCVPVELLVTEAERLRPALIALSSVNGHGFRDGLEMITALRRSATLAGTPVVIGGKLGVHGDDAERNHHFIDAGFNGVFEGGDASTMALFARFLISRSAPAAAP